MEQKEKRKGRGQERDRKLKRKMEVETFLLIFFSKRHNDYVTQLRFPASFSVSSNIALGNVALVYGDLQSLCLL